MSLHFFVPGIPVPQGSKVLGKTKAGKSYMREHKGGELKRWRETVAARAKACGAQLLEGPVALMLTFYFDRPKTSKRRYPDVKPDASKLARAVEDALSGICYRDDSQIIRLSSIKWYTDGAAHGPGVGVIVSKE